MTTIQQTILQQINANELKFAKYQMLTKENNAIVIKKGNKYLMINYNEATDLYDLELIKTKKFSVIKNELLEGIFAEQLKEIIQDHFNFEYVFHKIR